VVLGVLTTFRENGRGKHKREMLWVVRSDETALAERLWEGLEAGKQLKLKRWELKKLGDAAVPEATVGPLVRVYKQGNVDATRKVIAPLARGIIEGKGSN